MCMATAASLSAATPTTVITDEERRWVVIGICMNKLLTPVLRTVLDKEMRMWYKNLCLPPNRIDKQIYKKEAKALPPSKVKLNYGNINNNSVNYKSAHNLYDYNVKDPESLSKLFVQPFMAKFTGFNQSLDLSAALTVMSEADPFHVSGAAPLASNLRSAVRNEWAHCNFSHWSDANYFASIQNIESLVRKLKLPTADENDFIHELNNWKDKGVQWCCGQVVDPEYFGLVKTEVSDLYKCVKVWREEDKDLKLEMIEKLQYLQQFFSNEIQSIQETQVTMRKDMQELKDEFSENYETQSQQLEVLENKVAKLAIGNQIVPCLFMSPDRTEWFSGRKSELDKLHSLLQVSQEINDSKVQIVSLCGLGGNGKTSLAAEYAHRWKDYYHGGVFWFSGEDEATFAKSVEAHALELGCFTPEDGKDFVFKRTGLCDEDSTTKSATLVETLGGLPLALEQACAYIRHLSCSLSVYLEQYQRCSLELLKEQEASPVSWHESPERLAVHTTWRLNFEYIKQSKHGKFAIRFLRACAFFNPNEIQKELINPGKPTIKDEAYREYVDTPLGSSRILNLLTDFSLFKKDKHSSLTVHRLVQGVIREKLKSDNQEISSFVDAVCMLSFAFSKCPSPDELVGWNINSRHVRASTLATNPFLFTPWQKLCQHAQELLRILTTFDVLDKNILMPETARIVYECALSFNVCSKIDEGKQAIDFAKKLIDLGSFTESDITALFPHEVPLQESMRRYIFYSSMTPSAAVESSTDHKFEKTGLRLKTEKVQLQEGSHYDEDYFQKDIGKYSSEMAETSFSDPKHFFDRAMAHLKLKEYKNALGVSEAYLLKRRNCWLGFAIKAIALHGLNKIWEASSFAALAFYYNRDIFSDCVPFKSTFFKLKGRICVCNNSSLLIHFLLNSVSESQNVLDYPSKIIMIEPGDYLVNSSSSFEQTFFTAGIPLHRALALVIDDCILLGVENAKSSVVIRFHELPGYALVVKSRKRVMVANISFVFSKGHWESQNDAITTLLNCCFTSSLDESNFTFCSFGTDTFKNCFFKNCKSPGLTVIGEADVCVQKCVFSGGEFSGVKVEFGGCLKIMESRIHGNYYGMYLEGTGKKCNIINCEIFDNKVHGICVLGDSSNVTVDSCHIYQNDHIGILFDEGSSGSVTNCEVFENLWEGVVTLCNSHCNLLHNKIYRNKQGGVFVVPVSKKSKKPPSVVKFNKIFHNRGPGLYLEMRVEDTPSHTSVIPTANAFAYSYYYKQNQREYVKASCDGNECYENEDTVNSTASKDFEAGSFCSYCHKKCSSFCTKCFTAAYCNKECQKKDWKEKHKKECQAALEKSTVCVDILPAERPTNAEHNEYVPFLCPEHPGLQPKGLNFANPPKFQERFLVKVLAADEEWHINKTGPLLTICDRSLTVNTSLNKKRYPVLFSIVRECGVSSTVVEGWKKKFFWAEFYDLGKSKLRVFTKRFPPIEEW